MEYTAVPERQDNLWSAQLLIAMRGCPMHVANASGSGSETIVAGRVLKRQGDMRVP